MTSTPGRTQISACSVTDGVVWLTGSVPDVARQLLEARRAARSVTGVRSIINESARRRTLNADRR